MSALASVLGGAGLFLLGMGLMTDGLRLAAGPALERILASSTRTRARGLATGVLVTAAVQSSTAVTVAAIGFVNAGLLTLGQALWVLFGANVGTTVTGWLVALVGMKFSIEALALPLIGIGMALRLTGERGRRGALGMAIAGFGVLFLGIDLLKDSFAGAADGFVLPPAEGIAGIAMLLLVGILMTVVMQASAAALVIAFSAAQGGLVGIEAAAAVVIGANIGTTVTALIAAIGATPNAKRAAAAHVLFNVLTAVVALGLLPWLLAAIVALRDALGFDTAPAATLALFHSVFNLLGVALMWPLAGHLTHFLERCFHSTEEDEARPRYLDRNIAQVPALALDALEREVRRLGGIALRMLRAQGGDADPQRLVRDQQVVARLNQAIADFIAQLHRSGMSPDSARRLPHLLRIARYYETVAELAGEAARAIDESGEPCAQCVAAARTFQTSAATLLDCLDPEAPQGHGGTGTEAGPEWGEEARLDALDAEAARIHRASAACERDYQALKADLLEAGAQDRLPLTAMDARLRAASAYRRALQQAAKAAARLLAGAAAPLHTDTAD